MHFLTKRIRDLGPLRWTLLLCALIALILIPPPGTRAVYDDWRIITTVLVPVLAPLLFMLLMLDVLMSRVFMTDAQGEARRRLKTAMWVNLLVAALLVIRWLPYYAAIRV